eukprot:10236722-Ditylum_brightwellii.AAC.1
MPYWVFRNIPARLASAADAATKKWPPAVLRVFGSDRYDASKLIFKIISEAKYRITASGCILLMTNAIEGFCDCGINTS